jgi:hypothetical protein
VKEEMEERRRLSLTVLSQRLAVCRLPPQSPTPVMPPQEFYWSLTRTPDELSLLCREEAAPAGAECERRWRAFRVEGPLAFGLTGILAALTVPLAERGIPVFALSTYDTDYLLVREEHLREAGQVLRMSQAVAEVREE